MKNNNLYLYAIRNKDNGKIVNRKAHGSNKYYSRKADAMNKCHIINEEVVKYALIEVDND